MNICFGKAAFLIGFIAVVVIRAPYGARTAKLKVVVTKTDRTDGLLLALMWIATLMLPLVWVVTPLLSFADYTLRPLPFAAGIGFFAVGLWLFWRAHADLGANWSVSLELHEHHELITGGVYRAIRHPMYTSIFLQAIGQALFISNWVVGPAYPLAFLLMFALRMGAEERMMLTKFGDDYASYVKQTKRLIPNVW